MKLAEAATLTPDFQSVFDRMQKIRPLSASLSSEQINRAHEIARRLYSEGKYEEALGFFRILVQLSPERADHWKGGGATLQMLKMYEEALSFYAAARILYGSSPDLSVYIYAADCYLALNQTENALATLEAARKHAERTGNARVLKHVLLMKEIWEQPSSLRQKEKL